MFAERDWVLLTARADGVPAAAAAAGEQLQAAGIASRLLVVVRAGSQLLGTLGFDSKDAARSYSDDDIHLAQLASQLLASAVRRLQTEAQLRASREWLQMAQHAGRIVAWEWNLATDEMSFSGEAARLYGVSEDEVPTTGRELLSHIPPEDHEPLSAAIRESLRSGRPYRVEHRLVRGSTVWVVARGQAIRDSDGHASRVIGVSADITELKRAERALRQEKELAQVTLDSIADGVIRTDPDGRVTYLNRSAADLLAVTLDEARSRHLSEVYHVMDELDRQHQPCPVERCLAARASLASGRRILVRADGSTAAVRDIAAPILDSSGEPVGAVVAVHDVTHLRQLERETVFLATHDPLTGLINRREFERRLEQALREVHSSGREHTMCYLDLDDFKVVNDTVGHLAGDELLQQVAATLAARLRSTDTFARLGGDEFGALLLDTSTDEAVALVERLLQGVGELRYQREGRVFTIGASVGVVPLGRASGGLTDVLRDADAACYVAKARGRGQGPHRRARRCTGSHTSRRGRLGRTHPSRHRSRSAHPVLPAHPWPPAVEHVEDGRAARAHDRSRRPAGPATTVPACCRAVPSDAGARSLGGGERPAHHRHAARRRARAALEHQPVRSVHR